MKRLLFIVGLFLIIILSCSDDIEGEMIVKKDCTGSYLRFNDKDYHICNFEIVDDFEDGTEVKASFTEIGSCSAYDNMFVCDMLHLNEGWIKITKIE